MVASSTPARSRSVSGTRNDKSKKPTKIVILKLSSKALRAFEDPSLKSDDASTPSSAADPTPLTEEVSTVKASDAQDNTSEANSTPAPLAADASTPDGGKKGKASAGGTKRSLGQMMESNGLPKQRGKPGPKKKARLEDGAAEPAPFKSATTTGLTAGHKLGPKANQGAINAGLRNLDRSGKPCRKWSKKAFTLKSFTGVVWEVPSWKGNERMAVLNGEVSSDTKANSQLSSSDIKPNESDVAVDSNLGDQADPMMMSTPAASSPAPVPPTSTEITAQG